MALLQRKRKGVCSLPCKTRGFFGMFVIAIAVAFRLPAAYTDINSSGGKLRGGRGGGALNTWSKAKAQARGHKSRGAEL